MLKPTLKPTSFRLSTDTLDKLKALAQPHEPAASVIARALDCLEATTRPQDAPPSPSLPFAMTQRMEAMERRLAALEASSASSLQNALPGSSGVAHDALQAHEGRATATAGTDSQASQDKVTGRATGSASPHSNPGYPPDVKKLAVEMADQGAAPAEIRSTILDRCGRAPDRKNVAKLIRTWREASQGDGPHE